MSKGVLPFANMIEFQRHLNLLQIFHISNIDVQGCKHPVAYIIDSMWYCSLCQTSISKVAISTLLLEPLGFGPSQSCLLVCYKSYIPAQYALHLSSHPWIPSLIYFSEILIAPCPTSTLFTLLHTPLQATIASGTHLLPLYLQLVVAYLNLQPPVVDQTDTRQSPSTFLGNQGRASLCAKYYQGSTLSTDGWRMRMIKFSPVRV